MSVVIPTNRLDPWLDDAVASVLASTHDDLELVIVLDGIEPVGDPAWVSDPRVRVLPLPRNVGQASAMNAGVRASRGEYVARLDSDDLCELDRLAREAAYLDAHDSTVAVGSGVTRVDETGEITGVVSLPSGADVRHDLLLSNVISHSSLMFRRRSFDEVGGYDDSLRQMEDYVFILRLGRLGPIANLPERLIRYRVHSTQTSRGAAASGPHIRAVGRERLALASAIGSSRIAAGVKFAAWRAIQVLRHLGLRKPGHER